MPQPPFPPIRPGRKVSAERIDVIADATAAAGLTASDPLELLTQPFGGKMLRFNRHWPAFVRISGKLLDPNISQSGSGSGSYSGGSTVRTPRDDDYSGVEQITGLEEDVADYPGGIHFWADTIPLRAIRGETNVPAGSYVYAVPAPQGDHWLFSAAGIIVCPNPCDQSGSGTGCCAESSHDRTTVTTTREVEFRALELCDDGKTCCEVITKIVFPCPVRVCITECCPSGSGGS